MIEKGITKEMIPPRMTNLLQPADVCWFASLKRAYTARWNLWFLTEEKTFTTQGNAKSPGYARCIQWLSEIWKEFDPELIRKSFDSCGITGSSYLHKCLAEMVSKDKIITDFVDDRCEADEMEGFEADNDNLIFDEIAPTPQQTALNPSTSDLIQTVDSQVNVNLSTSNSSQSLHEPIQLDQSQIVVSLPAAISNLPPNEPIQQILIQPNPAQPLPVFTQMNPILPSNQTIQPVETHHVGFNFSQITSYQPPNSYQPQFLSVYPQQPQMLPHFNYQMESTEYAQLKPVNPFIQPISYAQQLPVGNRLPNASITQPPLNESIRINKASNDYARQQLQSTLNCTAPVSVKAPTKSVLQPSNKTTQSLPPATTLESENQPKKRGRKKGVKVGPYKKKEEKRNAKNI